MQHPRAPGSWLSYDMKRLGRAEGARTLMGTYLREHSILCSRPPLPPVRRPLSTPVRHGAKHYILGTAHENETQGDGHQGYMA